MAELLGNRASNQKAVGSIPGHAKLRCVLGQGTSPNLTRGNVPVLICKSLWIRASAKCKWISNTHLFCVGTNDPRVFYTYEVVSCCGQEVTQRASDNTHIDWRMCTLTCGKGNMQKIV